MAVQENTDGRTLPSIHRSACVAIVDSAHARLYAYHATQHRLDETLDLVNAGHDEQFSTTKPGDRWQRGGRGSTDDHRDAHVTEHDARFAKRVIDEVVRLVLAQGAERAILIANPKMLGLLRHAEPPLRADGVEVVEVAQDLAWMSSAQVHDHLAALHLIGPRTRTS
ncbi:MAG: Host attachment protein [Myxococcales bacterium]|nr:Host attachment protein [Myxococcales bacterium]